MFSSVRPQHISKLCLVNKPFNRFAALLLYHRVLPGTMKQRRRSVSDRHYLAQSLESALHVHHFTLRDVDWMSLPRLICREIREVAMICLSTSISHDTLVRSETFQRLCPANATLSYCSSALKESETPLIGGTIGRDGSLHSCALDSIHTCTSWRSMGTTVNMIPH